MIARVWEGVVSFATEAAYHDLLEREILPEIRATAGSRGATVLRRADADQVRFVVLSYWESLDAIRAFAGDDIARAHYRPAALALLFEPAPFVTHYEVLPGADLPRKA